MDIDVSASSSCMTKMQGVSKGTSLHEGGVRWVHAASRKRGVARMMASKPKHILEMQEDDEGEERKLHQCIQAGDWVLNEALRVPLCASVVYGTKEKDDDVSEVESEEEPDEEPEAVCAACSAYVQPVAAEYARDNGGLSAVLQLRDMYHNRTSKPAALAKLKGALEATTATSKVAEAKLDKLQEDLMAEHVHAMYLSQRLNEVQKTSKRSKPTTATCRTGATSIVASTTMRNTSSSSSKSSARRRNDCESGLTSRDRSDGPHHRRRMWRWARWLKNHETRGKGGQSIHHHLGTSHRLSPWNMSSRRRHLPRSGASLPQSRLVAKETNKAKCTPLQQYALEHWYMPTWQHELLKVLARDKNIVKSQAGAGHRSARVAADVGGHGRISAVQRVRGLLTFEALMPLKPDCSMAAVAAAYSCFQKGLIYNFVDMGFYAHTTSTNGWAISPNPLLAQWMLNTTILVNEDEVAYHCAVAGVTPTVMDDCWSFGYQWLVTSRSLANPQPSGLLMNWMTCWSSRGASTLPQVISNAYRDDILGNPMVRATAPSQNSPTQQGAGTTTFNRGCGTGGQDAAEVAPQPTTWFAALASAFDSAAAAHPTPLAPSPVAGPSNLTPILVFQPPAPMAPLATPQNELAAGTLIPHAMIGSTDQFDQYVVSESNLSLETFACVYTGPSSDSSTTSSTSPNSLSLQMAPDDPMSLISGAL
ncbi:hypothetical protein B0H10DRAFT_1938838 [Mycena sp. CBHHK59/15]|nr:hypothetical protein B0H10DRAFT_1938838 [Mycena sp. CBHHK59/15]